MFDRYDVFDHAEAEFGFLRVSVEGDRSLLMEFIYSENGAVGDTKEILKPRRSCGARNDDMMDSAEAVSLDSRANASAVNSAAAATTAQVGLLRPSSEAPGDQGPAVESA